MLAVQDAQATRQHHLVAVRPVLDDDDGRRHRTIAPYVERIARIARAHPAILGQQQGNAFVTGARLVDQCDKFTVAVVVGAGVAEAGAAHALAANLAPAASADVDMLRAVVPFTDGADGSTGGTERFAANGALGFMFGTDHMAAPRHNRRVLGAENLLTFVADQATAPATGRAARGACLLFDGDGLALLTGVGAISAVGRACDRVNGIEARADQTLALHAGHQAVLAETLPTGAARAQVRTVLSATGATYGTIRTDQRRLA